MQMDISLRRESVVFVPAIMLSSDADTHLTMIQCRMSPSGGIDERDNAQQFTSMLEWFHYHSFRERGCRLSRSRN